MRKILKSINSSLSELRTKRGRPFSRVKTAWAHNEIETRKKIFVFGPPQAGKSTLLAALISYINEKEGLILRRDPLDNPSGAQIIRRFIEDAEKQKFPLQTPAGEPKLVRFGFQEHDKDEVSLYEFYEAAGEDIQKFDPIDPRHGSASEELEDFLRRSDGVMLVAPARPQTTNQRESFTDFVEVLLKRRYSNKICLVLTKYDEISADYENHVKAAKANYRSTLDLLDSIPNSDVFCLSVASELHQESYPNYKSSEGVVEIMYWLWAL